MNLEPVLQELNIKNIVFNSKQVQEGDLFVAIPGFTTDGHDYIKDAVLLGARAVIGERTNPENIPVPYFQVPNARLALAKLSAELYRHPYRNHTMIGITGTNGKTTTAFMIRHILEYAKQSCALFGTIERYLNGKASPSLMTTQDPLLLQQWLLESKDDNVVMEVSSHGLSQSRVDGIEFDFALFTNLSHEHLDYHKTLDHYFNTKAHLFSLLNHGGEAIINTHCNWGEQLVEDLKRQGTPVLTFGQRESDTLELLQMENSLHPVFQVREKNKQHTLQLSVPGFHNVMNAMGAVLVARRMSIPFPVISNALASFPNVPGRLQSYRHPNGAYFIIDYAHTPDGLLHCLKTMSVYKPRRLIHIFGFRGNRDETKWEEMHKTSRIYCDQTILTLDDLNGISSESILRHYESYQQESTLVIADRTLAIKYAWDQTKEGDCVVITGKGTEDYQSSFELPSNSDPSTIECLSLL